MTDEYIRALPPRAIRYFEALVATEGDDWAEYLDVARAFAAVVLAPTREGVTSLQQRIAAGSSSGTMIEEIELALRVLGRQAHELASSDR